MLKVLKQSKKHHFNNCDKRILENYEAILSRKNYN